MATLTETLRNLDDHLSAPLFWAKLSPFWTWVYACPACFFGLPGVLAGPLLVLVGCTADAPIPIVWMCWACLLVFTYVIGFYVLIHGVFYSDTSEKGDNARVWIYRLFDLYISVCVGSFILAHYYYPEAVYPMQLYCLCTITTQTLIKLVKRGACRRRPCLREFSQPLPERAVPLSSFVSTSQHADESFPSGDAAQSVIFVATFLAMGFSFLWILLALVSGSGRVFFHAHHLFDVLSGMFIATTGCSMVISVFKEQVHWSTLLWIIGIGFGIMKIIPRFIIHPEEEIDNKKKTT